MKRYIYVPNGRLRRPHTGKKGFCERYSLRVARNMPSLGKALFVIFKGEDASDE